MSIQSDVEMLSIQALEYYARTHKLSEADTVHLFHKYQVFEKIILQHEYLHQLDFSETLMDPILPLTVLICPSPITVGILDVVFIAPYWRNRQANGRTVCI